MFQLIPFEQNTLPVSVLTALQDEFATGQKRGFPVISIAGKVFSVSRSGNKERVNNPGTNTPASALELIVVRASPGLSKTYYAKKFVQGTADKPDCYSNDGIAPATDALHPQCKSCQTCVHAQWGSRVTEDGKKAKACADVKRVAVAPLGTPEDVMMLRIPAASLRAWDDYCAKLKSRGLNPTLVATKMSFDYEVTYPALTFTAIGILPPDALEMIAELRESDVTHSIISASMMEVAETEGAEEIPFGTPAADKPVTRRGGAPRPRQEETLEEVLVKAASAAPPVTIKVEDVAPEPVAAPAIKVSNTDSIIAALESVEGLDFEGFDDD